MLKCFGETFLLIRIVLSYLSWQVYGIDINTQNIIFPFCLPSILSEYHFKRESDGGFINHTIIVAITYTLTSKTTLFQRYDSTLMKQMKEIYAHIRTYTRNISIEYCYKCCCKMRKSSIKAFSHFATKLSNRRLLQKREHASNIFYQWKNKYVQSVRLKVANHNS